jgi:hypothetical protein
MIVEKGVLAMQFVTKSISKSLRLWGHQEKETLGEFSIQFDISPFDDWHINIDEDLILCGNTYYESHKEWIGRRIQIPCNLSIHNRDTLTQEELLQIGDSFGIAICSKFSEGGIVTFQVFLKGKAFENLLNQLRSSQGIDLSISLVSTEGFDSKEQLWITKEGVNEQLSICMFSLSLNL